MGGIANYQWEIICLLLLALLIVNLVLLLRLKREVDILTVTNLPRDGYPEHMESAWEDIGDRGRFLTDLGGMSVGMREQLFDEFMKALNRPIRTVPAAGSLNDILCDLDELLTEIKLEKLRDSESID
jgi:hypothetical protein